MLCPYCKEPNTQVIDSRTSEEGSVIRRRRKCQACGGRFTTYEKALLAMPQIVKKGGMREAFSPEKVRKSMEIALRKRPVKAADVDAAVENVERQLKLRGEKEISSKDVGDLVLSELLKLDTVAYVRYGSVYFNFGTLEDFVRMAEGARRSQETMPK